MGLFACFLCTRPWGQLRWMFLGLPIKIDFSSVKFHGTCKYKLCWLSEPVDLGLCSSCGSCPSWGTRCGCQGEGSWALGVPSLLCSAMLGVWFMVECVSVFPTWSYVDLFSFVQWVGVTLLVFGFLSEGMALHGAVHLVSLWEERNSRIFVVAILVQGSQRSL